MSKKSSKAKASRPVHVGKAIPTWLKFAGLLVPILGLIISYLNYALEKQKISDDLRVLVSTDSNLNIEAGEMKISPPTSITFITENNLICGRDLIISNIGGVPASIVGFQGSLSNKSLSQPISFEIIGNEMYMALDPNTAPNGLFSIHVTILNDNKWLMTPEIFKPSDVLSFPVEVQAHSSIKVRVALGLHYNSKEEANMAFSETGNVSDPQNNDKKPILSMQFTTSTSKITEPVEFLCFNGIIFFPDLTTTSTLTPEP